MFTGIIERTGRVVDWGPGRGGTRRLTLAFEAAPWSGLVAGESIAVSGVCLTLVESAQGTLSFEVVGETLSRSTIGARRIGDRVNLERALRYGDAIGGHLVQGHVDAMGVVERIQREPSQTWCEVKVRADDDFLVLPKGSVAMNGVSLTVANVIEDGFAVALIPETLERTDLGSLEEGQSVNLEMDMIGKWVRSLTTRGDDA